MSDTPIPIRIMVADDHPLIRRGVADLIANQPDLALVAEVENGREAVDAFRATRPDVTLMDLQMPEMDGIEATTLIRAQFPSARIIILTTYDGDMLARRALQAGAQAYVLKSLIRTDLLTIVRSIHQGRKHVGAEVASQLAQHVTGDLLSVREVQVLELIAGGNANKVIGSLLAINEETVKGHVKKILSKLDAHDRTHAVTIGVKRGIIRL